MWAPLNISALEEAEATDIGAFIILFSGERGCAERIGGWAKSQTHPVFHVSSEYAEGVCAIGEFSPEAVRDYGVEALKKAPGLFSNKEREAAEAALLEWKTPEETPSGLRFNGHNITRPNYMSLKRARR